MTNECFLQTLVIVIRAETDDEVTNNTLSANLFNAQFSRNYAQSCGATFYGSLLDRCTLNPFVKKNTDPIDSEIDKNDTYNGADYFRSTSIIADTDPLTISSDPV